MNDIELGKENIQKALLEVSQNYLEGLELAPEEDVSFSPRLEKKMKRLLKSQEKPYQKLINAPYKRAIAACLVILLLTGTLVSCSFIREPIVAFFTGVYEKFTEFFFGDEDKESASKVIEEIHTLTYVPEGYELLEQSILLGNKELRTIWENNNTEQILFYQSVFVNKTTIDSENAEKKILSSGLQIATIKKDKVIYVFWNDNQYAYTLIVQALSEDTIIEMIDSFT